jgi:hypothetical protein
VGSLKATKYRGCLFRSRREARWAVFLDAAGIPWTYEKEGCRLEDGTDYFPDFWIPLPSEPTHAGATGEGYWLEIRGCPPTADEMNRCRFLATRTGHIVFLVDGQPGQEKDVWKWYGDGRLIHDGERFEFPEPEILFWTSAADPSGDGTLHVHRAIARARRARFDHGELP